MRLRQIESKAFLAYNLERRNAVGIYRRAVVSKSLTNKTLRAVYQVVLPAHLLRVTFDSVD